VLTQAKGEQNLDEAIGDLERRLAAAPDRPETLVDLGRLYIKQGDFARAAAVMARAAELAPNAPAVHVNQGAIHVATGDYASAVEAFTRALQLNPNLVQAHFNLAGVYERQGRARDALSHFDAMLILDPANVAAAVAKAAILFSLGQLEEAWKLYRRRHDIFWGAGRTLPSPLWHGESIAGKTVLLTYEQGLGEQIMFASMIPEIAAAAKKVIVECEARLVSLFARSFPGVEIVPWQEPWHPRVLASDIDFHAALGDPGERLRPSFAHFPKHTGYLKADPARTAALRSHYEHLAGGRPIVGLCWSSSAVYGQEKSIPPTHLSPLLGTKPFWVNLQYGAARHNPLLAAILHTHPDTDMTGDLDVAADHIAAMDMVVTISTATAHLAAALGKPTWVLLPKIGGLHWYWFTNFPKCPWYPTVQAFKQNTDGDWANVIQDAAQILSLWR
jgi:tetratricopeptide (TPR) repeat protein